MEKLRHKVNQLLMGNTQTGLWSEQGSLSQVTLVKIHMRNYILLAFSGNLLPA